jgi:hypothetical protein
MRSLSCGERAILNEDRDDGAEPYPQPVRVSEHTARKAHPCDACQAGGILPGERYTQLVYLDHDEGERGFKIERHCHIVGCQRSGEHLERMYREADRAEAAFHRDGSGDPF